MADVQQAAPQAQAEGAWFAAGTVAELRAHRNRKCIELDGRSIVLFLTSDRTAPAVVHALDSRCYHMGGPLIDGDIEDYNGSVVIECPWHHYRILTATGEGIYKDLNGDIRGKGKRQRTHPVQIDSDGETIRVQVVWPAKKDLLSDHYQPRTEEEKRRMGLIPRKPK